MSVVHVKPDEIETWQQKLMRRFKEEPFVPIGTALTCFALIMASRKLGKKGESKSMNRWFRARIIFQGATIGAIVAGSYAMKNKDNDAAAQETPSAEELKLKERLEFEQRLRKAEETHELEQAMRNGKPKEQDKGMWARLGLGRGPAQAHPLNSLPPVAPAVAVSPPSDPIPPPQVEAAQIPRKSSWGWWGRSSSSASDPEKKV